MAEDAKVRNRTISITKSAKNSLSDIVEDVEVGGVVMGIIIKQSKNHLPKIWMDL